MRRSLVHYIGCILHCRMNSVSKRRSIKSRQWDWYSPGEFEDENALKEREVMCEWKRTQSWPCVEYFNKRIHP